MQLSKGNRYGGRYIEEERPTEISKDANLSLEVPKLEQHKTKIVFDWSLEMSESDRTQNPPEINIHHTLST